MLRSVSHYLEQKLNVTVIRSKSGVSLVKDSSVLGFHIHRKKLVTVDHKVKLFNQEVKQITRRCPGISIESRLIGLREYVQGWMSHYGCGLMFNDTREFDGWLRRRLRMCCWKQWRKSRRRIRELIKPGVKVREAISLVLSRKSYWRISKTLATNSGLSITYVERIGLISVRALWCKIHHPATAR